MIFGIPIGILLVILSFYSPHILLVLFIVDSVKEWKRHTSIVWKTAVIATIPATVALILMSLPPTYEVFRARPDPFFFIPLLAMLFYALPIALGIFLVGWSLPVIFITLRAKRKDVRR